MTTNQNETIDDIRERVYAEQTKKGTDHNTALAIACSHADREMRGRAERGELAVAVDVVGASACGSVTTAHDDAEDTLPSIDELRSKYYAKEVKRGAEHNAALGIACQKADAKVARLAESRLAARHAAPPPAADETPSYAALLGRAEAQGDDLELAAKRQELARLELRAEIRAAIREEVDALRASLGQERGSSRLLVAGGRR